MANQYPQSQPSNTGLRHYYTYKKITGLNTKSFDAAVFETIGESYSKYGFNEAFSISLQSGPYQNSTKPQDWWFDSQFLKATCRGVHGKDTVIYLTVSSWESISLLKKNETNAICSFDVTKLTRYCMTCKVMWLILICWFIAQVK